MKISKLLILSLLAAPFFVSCSTTDTKSNEESSEENSSIEETCTYSYISDSTHLKWTAYKFTARAGVGGTFDHIAVNGTKESDTMIGVLVGADFTIHTSSVNSGNTERDPKLVAHFFNQLVNTETITGKIISANDGEAVVTITLNDKSVDAVGKITSDGLKVSLSVSIDMADFEGLDVIDSLNEVCSAKHTDETGGESKLWPDVDIVVSTVLNKECK